MGNCKSWLQNRNPSNGKRKKITLALFGLDNAGKTVTAKGLKGESLDFLAPTYGFSTFEFKFDDYNVLLYDLGGGTKIRDIWSNYYAEIHGTVFIVDSTDVQRLLECKTVITELLQNKRVSGKPLLLLANKSDKSDALDDIEINKSLDIQALVNETRVPCKVSTCSAIRGQGKNLDESIRTGISWILRYIDFNWETLSERVTQDVADQAERDAKKKSERMARLSELKSKREAEERARRRERGEASDEEEKEDEPHINPFKPYSRQNNKKQEPQDKSSVKNENNSRSRSREDSIGSKSPERNGRSKSRDDLFYADSPLSRAKPASKSSDRYSRLESDDSDSHNNRFSNGITENRSSYNRLNSGNSNSSYTNLISSSSKVLGRTRSLSPPRVVGQSARLGLDEVDGVPPAPFSNRRLVPALSHLPPLETPDSDDLRSGKKKKKPPKRNQTVPTDDEEVSSGKEGYLGSVPKKSGWKNENSYSNSRSEPGNPGLRTLRNPRLEPLREPSNGFREKDSDEEFNKKWGLVDSLPEINRSHGRRGR